jgi:DNA-binding transcriptional MerR regulator
LSVGDLAHRLNLVPATLRRWERVGIYRAPEICDAQLAHLLRRDGYLLNHIATVLTELRQAGGPTGIVPPPRCRRIE